ncbi:MAG: hypothetical protein UV74_C0013G0410 [Candidatus Woesebacteria bacterium GW2011_GWB1_43_14]|uniref:Uncharacterized protein n=1 Tax=Candidatus Woesebacteria bacterium GW2011_GWB1_43_14 TaxID=1618578 RepID=A0A0G1GEJ5_9BACT|nr:MAG: hypothetical protein UT21_C0001G0122 [Candidatus Woesebacteria bacterium GW2011_GWA1_39_11b]KKS78292.1 MAG: hypothetical protein UV51_C0001G0008 [Candidatus Woesebacteria bacterium GW2011_GWC1_42_9]KKS97288.1 MAG: hypothetical protein UV74_C0013G0410 [Candidatus Woesebacteria bacterium GW2011_GWB1_43_14]
MISDLKNIDRFYYVFGGLLLITSIFAIFTLRTIFSAFTQAGQIDRELLEASTPRIDLDTLDSAYQMVTNKKVVPLDVK